MTDIKPQERSAEEQSDLDSRLIGAADRGDTKAVQTLLASGGDEHAKDDLALRLAAENGYTEIVQALLAAGADVHAGDDYALRWAATFGHTEIVQLLVRHIFAPESWRGKSRAEIEAGASALYDKIKANIPSNPIKPEYLRQAASILRDCALDCWFQVRPPPPPGFKISPLPAQARPV